METKQETKKIEEEKNISQTTSETATPQVEEKAKEKIKVVKIKKDKAIVRANDVPISAKHSIEICRYIKGRKIDDAIELLKKIKDKKMPLPMRGEIPHRKGEIMAGRYPLRACEEFINLLKGLNANSLENGLNDPIIFLASATYASRPMKRGGRRFKRAYVYLEAKDKVLNKNKSKKEEKK